MPASSFTLVSKKNRMRYKNKIWIRLVTFVLLLFAVDIFLGFMLDYMQSATTNNKNGHMIHSPKDDVVIFGSSRAEGHYSPLIFQDSLGGTCYNYGSAGNGIISMAARMKLVSSSHMPKIVIYDILPSVDIEQNDNTKYLSSLKPLYYEGLQDYIDEIDSSSKFKMVSSMYRYNSVFLDVIKSFFSRGKEDVNNGYNPAFGHLKLDKNVNAQTAYCGHIDSLKLKIMEDFILEYKDKTKLIFVFSPRFKEHDNSDQKLKELFEKYRVIYWDYQKLEPFYSDKKYWNDGVHLNFEGSSQFTKYIASQISLIE